MSSAWEHLHLAIHVLVGPEAQRARLIKAYKSHLVRLSIKDVPSEIRSEFARLARRLTSSPAEKGSCSVTRAVATLDDKEVAAVIGTIIWMYDAVARYQPISIPRAHTDENSAMPSLTWKMEDGEAPGPRL